MSNNINNRLLIPVLTVMLLTFAAASAVSYSNTISNNSNSTSLFQKLYGQQSYHQQQQAPQQQQPSTSTDLQVQVLQGKPDNPGNQGKDKGDKDKGQKDKKPKQVQNVKITGLVDVSQVTNATDAAQAYSFTVTSGAFTSKAKQLDSNITDSTEALKLNFNGKLAVTSGDSFTITGVSSTDAYNTVSSSGTFISQPQGKSGKTFISGELDSPLVLQETAIEDLS